jgi:DNA-directed RNA polymerase sigma subunit (sigma70/sigma32)
LPALGSRERQLVAAYYGLPGGPRQTQVDLARERGVTRQAISAAIRIALKKMRAAAAADCPAP